MTEREIKRFQAECGMMIETARAMRLELIGAFLVKSMDLSVEYKRLVQRVSRFVEQVRDESTD